MTPARAPGLVPDGWQLPLHSTHQIGCSSFCKYNYDLVAVANTWYTDATVFILAKVDLSADGLCSPLTMPWKAHQKGQSVVAQVNWAFLGLYVAGICPSCGT